VFITPERKAIMLFVVRFAGEPDVRWRALNARNAEEARSQALALAYGECVEYGVVDADTGSIVILGTIGGFERPTGT
jgi:hypothetical protein